MIENSKIIVTGGAGMIGSNLVKKLIEYDNDVIVVDNLWRGKLENLYGEDGCPVIDLNSRFYELDLSVPDVLEPIIDDVEYVVHLADIVAGIKYVFNNQGIIFRQNILINSNVISTVRRFPIKGFVYVGTACSFPAHLQHGIDAAPLKEEDQYPASPESAYGWSKLMGEYEASLMEQETDIPVSIPVLHNVYGSPCDYEDGRGQVIPSLIRKAIRYPDEPFIVWGSGNQGRAFIHVDDVVDGLVSAMDKGLGKGVIQLGPNICTSIKEIAETVVEISGKNIDIVYDTSKPEGDQGRCADYRKAKEILGWEPKVGLKDGLTELYYWIYKKINSA